MKKCPSCLKCRFGIIELVKTHFFSQRLPCQECASQFEFGRVHFLVQLFTRTLDFFVLVVPIGYALFTEAWWLIGVSLFLLMVLYLLEILSSPLIETGLKTKIRQQLSKNDSENKIR